MNNTHEFENRDIDGHSIDGREWQAQERALQDARRGVPATPGDPLAARYRKVTDALRVPPPELLPADFAERVARQAQANARAPATAPAEPDPRFENGLLRGALAVFGLASAVVVAMYGQQWLPPILQLLHLDSAVAVNWTLALAASLGTTWLTEQLRRHKVRTHAA